MTEKQMFEIPTEMRDFAEKNVEQARVAYGQFMEFMSQAMNAWSSSGGPEAGNFKAIQDRAIAFAKENAERSFSLASDLAKAKDMQEVVTLQSRYVQTQMQTFGIQAQQLSWLMADAFRNMQSSTPKGWDPKDWTPKS
jgi:phasin